MKILKCEIFFKKFTFSENVLTGVILTPEKFCRIVSIDSVGVRNAVAYVQNMAAFFSEKFSHPTKFFKISPKIDKNIV